MYLRPALSDMMISSNALLLMAFPRVPLNWYAWRIAFVGYEVRPWLSLWVPRDVRIDCSSQENMKNLVSPLGLGGTFSVIYRLISHSHIVLFKHHLHSNILAHFPHFPSGWPKKGPNFWSTAKMVFPTSIKSRNSRSFCEGSLNGLGRLRLLEL